MAHSVASVLLLLSECVRNHRYLDMALAERGELPALREVICFDNVLEGPLGRFDDQRTLFLDLVDTGMHILPISRSIIHD